MNIGDRFHRLVVIGLIPHNKNPKAKCVCDCGNVITPQRGSLRNGRAKSCGCLRKELLKAHSESMRGTGMSIEEKRAKSSAASLEWQRKNREKYRARINAWHAKNKEKLVAVRARFKDRKKAYDEVYRVKNKDRLAPLRRLNDHKRRFREQSLRGKVSKDIANRLFELQKGKCAICKKSMKEKFEIDHIQPLARGGIHDDLNFQLLCGFCNRSKGAKDPIKHMQEKGFLL